MRHGKRLGMQDPFLYTMVDTLVSEFGEAYPELKAGRDIVIQVIRSEEERFDDDIVDLGRLKGNIGSQNYELPSDIDLSHYSTVVIWCNRFDSAFGAADLA